MVAALAATWLLQGAYADGAGYVLPAAAGGVRFVSAASPAPGALAWGSYIDSTLNSTGWASLDVHTDPAAVNDTLASYAAGFLEGALTQSAMEMAIFNCGADAPNSKKLQKYLDDNWEWMGKQVADNSGNDPYWAHVGALMAQVVGLADGAASVGGTNTFTQAYQAIIAGGDLFNLAPLYGATEEQAARARSVRRTTPDVRNDHCSALIRLTPGNGDLMIAHTTWAGFENMGLRILKRFDLPFTNTNGGTPVPGRFVALSGSPSMLAYSSDDFYVLSSGLVTLETTINNNNATLAREFASHKVVLEWARNVLANRLASSGATWSSTFSRFASGTYTNSWMVVDTSRFVVGKPPLPGLLTVVEEMPGHISSIDRTDVLISQAFWPSYNVPSDPFIFNISGAQALVDKYGGASGAGAYFTFANTSRANIFRRDAPGVVDEAGFRRIMRYNNFKHDPLSGQGCGVNPPYAPANAIADRSDLAAKGGSSDYVIPGLAFGDAAAVDAKYTLFSWIAAADVAGGALPLAAIAGPTNDQQPTFSWANTTLKGVPHEGHPVVWDFGWVRQPW